MELAPEKERMSGQLDDLPVCRVRRGTGDAHSRAGQHRFVLAIELVTVTVAFADLCLAVRFGRKRPRLKDAWPRAQAHRSTHLFDSCQLAQLVDHAMRSRRV